MIFKKQKKTPPPPPKKKTDFAQMIFLFNIIIYLHYLPLKVRKRHGIFLFLFPEVSNETKTL